ncbi:hypothetical protein J7E96_13055 [Streptomyces sp. ISL-96]|uniref:hypothetical protein n=1 Tax=Streptomyces sp. ISL-96 TaxID=2819191 RepID=UPI001BE5BFBE|nr:hypothetical protein [Streptomyces sp. ISL-96]MBT2489433.1 hypothetical protein [Streptomyces sp. ISL-96]
MREWVDPRYADVVDSYRTQKAMAGPPPKRSRGWARKSYGDPFVIVVDPTTQKSHTLGR